MKRKYLYLLLLPMLLTGCNKKKTDDLTIHFETGYEDINVTDVHTSTVSMPSITGMNVEGFYKDEYFEEEFNFNNLINESTTIYVKGLKGSGTENDPYIVESSNSFNSVAYSGKEFSGVVKVIKDFELAPKITEEYTSTTFKGTLNGNNHTINLKVEDNDGVSIGVGETSLLYKTSTEALVKDLNIIGAINGNTNSVGTIANFNYGNINNIKTYGVSMHKSNGYNSGVRLMSEYDEDNTTLIKDFGCVGMLEDLEKGGAGGICGTNYGSITNCINFMNIQATIGAGGISGINYGTIENCFNKGAIGTTGNNAVNSTQIRDHNFDFSYIGGMSGANFGTIHQCGNMNQIFVARLPWRFNDAPSGQNDYINRIRVGGIAGYNKGTYDNSTSSYTGGIISECFNYGRVHGDMQVGGIAGYSSGLVCDCQVMAFLGARSCLGGIVGWMSGDKQGDRIPVVTRCYCMSRVVEGSDGTFVDELGNNVPGVKLITIDSSHSSTNISEYYNIAKYATNCIYHNYGGVDKPINPSTNQVDTNSRTSKATLDDSSLRNVLAKIDNVESNIWGEYKSTTSATAIVGFNKSWQCYLNLVLAWQEKDITFVIGDQQTIVHGVAGIDYVNSVVAKTSNGYIGLLSSNYSCAMKDKLPTLPNGKVWKVRVGDNYIAWDGILTSDITVYAMDK